MGARNYKCDVCKISFKTKDVMARHRKEVHLDSLLKCEFCNLEVKGKLGMTRHLDRMHINQNRYHKCEFCDKAFRSRQHLRRHKFKIHNIKVNENKNSV